MSFCKNILTVTPCELPKDKEMFKKFVKSAHQGVMHDKKYPLLGNLFPIPDDFKGDVGSWQKKHWGVGSEVSAQLIKETEESVTYDMQTSWAVPGAWLEHVSKEYANLLFRVIYDAPMESEIGAVIAKKGKLIHKKIGY